MVSQTSLSKFAMLVTVKRAGVLFVKAGNHDFVKENEP